MSLQFVCKSIGAGIARSKLYGKKHFLIIVVLYPEDFFIIIQQTKSNIRSFLNGTFCSTYSLGIVKLRYRKRGNIVIIIGIICSKHIIYKIARIMPTLGISSGRNIKTR